MTRPLLAIALSALAGLAAAGCSSESPAPGSGGRLTPGAPDQAAPPPAAPALETAAVPRPARVAVDDIRADDPTGPGGWTAAEAGALAIVEQLVEAQARLSPKQSLSEMQHVVPPPARAAFAEGGIVTFGDFCFRCVLAGRDGRPTDDGAPDLVADAFAIYAWPATAPGRTICGFEGGVLTTFDPDYRGEARAPEPDAAFSTPTFAGLFATADGQDGNRWTRLDAGSEIETVTIQVVGPDGRPVEDFPVMVGPRKWFEDSEGAADYIVELGGFALPTGRGAASKGGALVLRGVCAPDVALITPYPAAQVRFENTPAGPRLHVPEDARNESGARPNANQSAAIATLKNLCSAQAQFQVSCVQDTDGDGVGEYGFLAEMAGAVPLRVGRSGTLGSAHISPPVLSGAFGNVHEGIVQRSGYLFQVWLPGPQGPVGEASHGGSEGIALDPDSAEIHWYAFAWPAKLANDAGDPQRVFYVDQSGDVWAAPNTIARYEGRARTPRPDAFGGYTPFSTESRAQPHVGADGESWVVVN